MTWKIYSDADENRFYIRLGRKIFGLRKMLGISQEELAGRADCSQKYISKIESGQARPSAVLCVRLATALNCSMDTLFTELLSEEQVTRFVVNASERILMDEVLRAVQRYLESKK